MLHHVYSVKIWSLKLSAPFSYQRGRDWSCWQLLGAAWRQTHCRTKKEEVERNQVLGDMHELLDRALPETNITLDFSDSEPVHESLYCLSRSFGKLKHHD